MKTKWLINPFERIAGWQALVIGIAVMSLTAVIGKINNVAFDGALDMHTGASFSFAASFIMQGVDFLALFLALWLAGVCFSWSKIRMVDVAGTVALSRLPMLLLSVVCFLPIVPNELFDFPRLIPFVIISFIFIVWMISLLYNAYTVSCHLKGGRSVISFIGALLVAEIVSKCVFVFLLSCLFTGTAKVSSSNSSGIAASDSTIVVGLSDIHQTAEKVVKAFEQNDFDAIVAYFDNTMKKGLSAGTLKLTWVQVNLTYGKFENADMANIKESKVNEYRRLEIPFNFKNGKLYLRLAFNKDGTICGMFIQP